MRPLLAFALACTAFAQQSPSRQPVEGTIALTRFNFRFETSAEFQIQQGSALVPFRVPEGKILIVRHLTATCNFVSGGRLNFWTLRSSTASLVHHYLPIRPSNADDNGIWVASEQVQFTVPAGARPVASFQRAYSGGFVNDGCVGSWSGYLEDAPSAP